jgi:hypothetical protein
MKYLILLLPLVSLFGCAGDGQLRADVAGANIEIAKTQARESQQPLVQMSVPMPASAQNPELEASAIRAVDDLRIAAAAAVDPQVRAALLVQQAALIQQIGNGRTMQITVRNPAANQPMQVAVPRDEWAGVTSDFLKTVGTLGGIYLGGEAAANIAGTVGAGISGVVGTMQAGTNLGITTLGTTATSALTSQSAAVGNALAAMPEPAFIPTQVVPAAPVQVVNPGIVRPEVIQVPTQVIEQPTLVPGI